MRSDESFILGLDRLSGVIQTVPFFDEPAAVKIWVRMMARVAERRRFEESREAYPEDVALRRKTWEQTRAKAEFERAKKEVEIRKAEQEKQLREEQLAAERRAVKKAPILPTAPIAPTAEEERRIEEEVQRIEEELRMKEALRLSEERRLHREAKELEETLQKAERERQEEAERLLEENRLNEEYLDAESRNKAIVPPRVAEPQTPISKRERDRLDETLRQEEERRLNEEYLAAEARHRATDRVANAPQKSSESIAPPILESAATRVEELRLVEERPLSRESFALDTRRQVVSPPKVAEPQPTITMELIEEETAPEPYGMSARKRKDKKKARAETPKKARRQSEPYLDPHTIMEAPDTVRGKVLKEALKIETQGAAASRPVATNTPPASFAVASSHIASDVEGITLSETTTASIEEDAENTIDADKKLREQAERNIGNRLPTSPRDAARWQLFKPAMIAAVMFVVSVSAGFMGLRFFFAESPAVYETPTPVRSTGTVVIAGGAPDSVPYSENLSFTPVLPDERSMNRSAATKIEAVTPLSAPENDRAKELRSLQADLERELRQQQEEQQRLQRQVASASSRAEAPAPQRGATVIQEEPIRGTVRTMPSDVAPELAVSPPPRAQPQQPQQPPQPAAKSVAVTPPERSTPQEPVVAIHKPRDPVPRLFPMLGTSWNSALHTLIPSNTPLSARINVRVSVRDMESPESMKAIMQIQKTMTKNMTLLVEQDTFVPVGYVRMVAIAIY